MVVMFGSGVTALHQPSCDAFHRRMLRPIDFGNVVVGSRKGGLIQLRNTGNVAMECVIDCSLPIEVCPCFDSHAPPPVHVHILTWFGFLYSFR